MKQVWIISRDGLQLFTYTIQYCPKCNNLLSIEESAKMNIVFTFIEAVGIILIIILGFSNIGHININFLEFPSGTPNIFLALISGTTLIFFAFTGFEHVANIAEETEHPKKTIPRAIIISIIITTILYTLMAIAVILSGVPNLETLPNPLSAIAEAFLGSTGHLIISIIALFATSNTILFLLISTSRQLYGMAMAEAMPRAFTKIHHKTSTPYFAVIIVMIMAIGFTFFGDIELVARVSVFATFLAYFIINFSVIYLRKSRPDLERQFIVKPNIKGIPLFSALGAITCFLMFFTFLETFLTFIILIVIIFAGLGIYGIQSLVKRLHKTKSESI